MEDQRWDPFTEQEKKKPAITLCRRVHGKGDIKYIHSNNERRKQYFIELCGYTGSDLEVFVNRMAPGRQGEGVIRKYLTEYVEHELDKEKIMVRPEFADGSEKYPLTEFVYKIHVKEENLQGTKVESKELIDRLVKEFTANCVIW